MSVQVENIFVYAHWQSLSEPKLMGVLKVQESKGRRSFGFAYDSYWLKTEKPIILDPEIEWYSGIQYPKSNSIFGIFADCMPDTWGRTLMRRRASFKAKSESNVGRNLSEIDFLLGVNDETRMGALRFKLDKEGPFIENDLSMSAPSWTSIRELQHSVELIESDKVNNEVRKWLMVLMAPGSSLGGARPKANVSDLNGQIWMAKFPSNNDTIDKAAWEYLAYKLAIKSKINMSECRIEKVSGKYHTFFTKRFDRHFKERIHFASAMTMTENSEDKLKDTVASYIEIAEFIQFSGSNITEDLHQLWRRIVFNVAISNTDDHLRNHGFLLTQDAWRLSPAYDINPSIDKNGLALNIDLYSNELNIELAKSVGVYFKLNAKEMDSIIKEVLKVVKDWEKVAIDIGIPRSERILMSNAFRV